MNLELTLRLDERAERLLTEVVLAVNALLAHAGREAKLLSASGGCRLGTVKETGLPEGRTLGLAAGDAVQTAATADAAATAPTAASAPVAATRPEDDPIHAHPEVAEYHYPATISEEYMRDCMNNLFASLIGDDWEELIVSDSFAKKKKQQITANLLSLARAYGASKPTQVALDKRAKFLDQLRNIVLDDNGEVTMLAF